VTQSITSIDAIYGNLETETSISYDVIGVGTVCSIFTDTTKTFYDYSQQEGGVLAFGSPALLSSLTEVLSLVGGTVSGQPVSTQAKVRSMLAVGQLGIAVPRERFRHAIRLANIARNAALKASLQHLEGIR
jgi:hypothetical protein